MLELYNSSNTLIWNNGGLPLDKGVHAHVSVPQGVYRARGSSKFSVLSGDPITRYVCGYYAMDQNGFGASKELYTWVPQLYGHCKFIVFAYEDGTQVTIIDTDTWTLVWSGMLNSGKAHVEQYPVGANKYFAITSNKNVTVSVQPWVTYTSSYHQGAYIQDREGAAGIGTDLIGSTLYGGYMHILSYADNTNVDVFNSLTDVLVASYMLNEGESVEANPGNGLRRIISSDYVSAYSGWGQWNADFAPVEFADVLQKRVFIDIKPQSCPNPLNLKSRGLVPVAILGTDEFDVTQIDPATIVLGREGVEVGVELFRWAYEDVATPFEGELCDCHTQGWTATST